MKLSQEHSTTKSNQLIGFVHSIESLGTLDGPGLRTVVFLQGCPLKCKYCHNIDCGTPKVGKEYSIDELVDEVTKYQPYWGDKYGGVTISGGEPTFQPDFLEEFTKELSNKGVHVTLDSCLVTSKKILARLIPNVDYWMVSIKHMFEKEHLALTNSGNKLTLGNIEFLDTELSKINDEKNLRIRFVVIPELTDSKDHIKAIGQFVSKLENLDCLELLPYGSHGKHKWKEMFGSYPLEHIRDADMDDVKRVAGYLSEFNIPLKY